MITALVVASNFLMMPVDMLPDITIWNEKLLDTSIDTTQIPGRTLLRLSTGTPNIGTGRLELRGGAVIGTNLQQVNQRVYRDDGTFWERPAGSFTYHPGHSHIHFDGWCRYRLRAKLADGSAGAVLATGQKTSFCILDLTVHNNQHPNFRNPGFYSGCGSTVQGLTPGWADIYSKNLTDQWIDVTGIADGDYILEAEVDPDGHILEANENNNIGQVPVRLGAPPPLVADVYEENDSKAQLDGRVAGTNSPQLGVVNGLKTINLTMQSNDDDWFRFRLNSAGTAGDYIKITSIYTGGDIDMRLYNAAGTQIGASESGTNTETISMSGRPIGYYYVRIWPYSGNNPGYTFTIQPSGNQAPTLNLTAPVMTKPLYVERSLETFRFAWTATDPESDPMTMSIWKDRNATSGKTTTMVEGYQNLPATDLAANVNTAEMPVGPWYFYGRLSDGGLSVERRTQSTVVIYIKGDLNYDGHVDLMDWNMYTQAVRQRVDVVKKWLILLDHDRDGDFDKHDKEEFYEHTHE